MSYSKEYLEELKTLHNKKTFGLNRNIPEIVHKIIKENNIKSFLDFGAGKGHTSATISQTYPEIDLHTFDPATFPNPLPKEVELTYSSDVLEHVEPDLIDETLNDLCARSTRYQYHLIACHPAKKALSDGRNAHLIIENPKWWKKKIESLNGWNIIHEEITERHAKVKKGPPRHVVKYIVVLEKS